MAHLKSFELWNNTTSLFTLPKRIVADQQRNKVRGDFIQAIGPKNVKGVQILPRLQLRVEFTSQALRRQFDMKGLDFRGVHLTPTPGYTAVYQVFVEGAPLQSPNQHFFDAFASHGRVTAVKHLPVKGYPHIQSGTRMVSMTINDTLPIFIIIDGTKCKVNYSGRPIKCFGCGKEGHAVQRCPTKAKSINVAPVINNTANNVKNNSTSASTSVMRNGSSYAAMAAHTSPKHPFTNRGDRIKLPLTFVGPKSPSVNAVGDDVPPAISNADAWPARSVLPGSEGSLNVIVAAPSTWVPIPHVDTEQLGPLPRLEDLDLSPLDTAHDSDHEDMPPKARKRGREETPVDSDPEDAKRSLVVPHDGGLSDYESASESASEQDDDVIQDTTVDVNLDPDAPLRDAIIPTTTQPSEDAPASSPLFNSPVEDSGAAEATTPLVRTEALDSSDHIEEFTPTPPTVRRIVSEPPLNDSDDIQSPFSSGDSAAAADAQQLTESPDIVSPTPLIVINTVCPFPAIDGLPSAVVSPGSDAGLSIDLTQVDDLLDVVWEGDGCSSHNYSPSLGSASPTAVSPTFCSESVLPSSGSDSYVPPLPGESALRQAIEDLLCQHLESEAPV